MNLILCGLPSSGKTSAGMIAAKILNWNFIDTDRLIENAYSQLHQKKCSCREIFLSEGESKFRDLEKQVLTSLHCANTIIALGGGTLGDRENIQTLTLLGKIIYLKSKTNVLWDRFKIIGIPAYLNPSNAEQDFYTIASQRSIIYSNASKYIIDTENLTLNNVAEMIVKIKENLYGE